MGRVLPFELLIMLPPEIETSQKTSNRSLTSETWVPLVAPPRFDISRIVFLFCTFYFPSFHLITGSLSRLTSYCLR